MPSKHSRGHFIDFNINGHILPSPYFHKTKRPDAVPVSNKPDRVQPALEAGYRHIDILLSGL